jgi:hypothetical protein
MPRVPCWTVQLAAACRATLIVYYGSGGSGGSGGIPGGGGRGGDGVGGTATFTIANDFTGTTESGTVQSIEVYADGYGESGASAFTGGAGGGAGWHGRHGAHRGERRHRHAAQSAPVRNRFRWDGGNSSKGTTAAPAAMRPAGGQNW